MNVKNINSQNRTQLAESILVSEYSDTMFQANRLVAALDNQLRTLSLLLDLQLAALSSYTNSSSYEQKAD